MTSLKLYLLDKCQLMEISIPTPCAEDWNKMTPSEKGRFCTNCQKQVINFKGMAPETIKHFLEAQTGSVCGRFSTHQLETFNAAYQELPTPSNIKQWTMATILAGMTTLTTIAQDVSSVLPTSSPIISQTAIMPVSNSQVTQTITTSDTSVVLKGQIIDAENDEGIPFASIVVLGTKIGTSSDFDGHFILRIPKSSEAITLQTQFIGYETSTHTIVPDSNHAHLTIKLEQDLAILGIVGGLVVDKKQLKANKRAHRKAARLERKRKKALSKKQP